MSLLNYLMRIFLYVMVLSTAISCKKDFKHHNDPVYGDIPALPPFRTSTPVGTFSVLTHQVPRFPSIDIILLDNGTLLGIFGNEFLKKEHCSIYKTISTDGGITWSEPSLVNIPAYFLRHLIPTNLFRSGSRIFMVVQNRKIFSSQYLEGDIPLISYSDDNGETWSNLKLMFKGPAKEFVVSNSRNCTRTKTGRLVVPVSYGLHVEPQRANILYSDDNGESWKEGRNPLGLHGAQFGEPSVAQLNDGRLLMLIRTSLGYIYKAYSTDDGNTWSEPQPTTLQSPWTAHCLRVSPQGYLLVAYTNETPVPGRPGFPRNNMTLAVSYDYGETWTDHTPIIQNTDVDGHFVMSPSLVFLEDQVFMSFLYFAAHAIKPINCIIAGVINKSDIFRSINKGIEEDWESINSWFQTGAGITEILNNDSLHLADNTGSMNAVYKIQQASPRFTLEFRSRVEQFTGNSSVVSSASLGTSYSNGIHLFNFRLEEDGIYVVDNNGSWVRHMPASYLNTKNDWHVWKVVANEGQTQIFMDGELVVSPYSLQRDVRNAGRLQHFTVGQPGSTSSYIDYTHFKPSISNNFYENWGSMITWLQSGQGVKKIQNRCFLHLSDSTDSKTGVSGLQSHADQYTLRFRAKLQRFVNAGNVNSLTTLGTAFSDGKYRFSVKLESDGIYLLGNSTTWVKFVPVGYLKTKSNWHVWRVDVDNGVASIYMDGQLIRSGFAMQPYNSDPGKLEHWTRSRLNMPSESLVDYTHLVYR